MTHFTSDNKAIYRHNKIAPKGGGGFVKDEDATYPQNSGVVIGVSGENTTNSMMGASELNVQNVVTHVAANEPFLARNAHVRRRA